LLIAGGGLAAQAGEMKLQATLVWGTDDASPPAGKNYKPVDQEILKKLQEDLPLKWKHYFEVSRTNFTLQPKTPKQVAISAKCELNLQNMTSGGSELEVVLIGKGKEVVRRKQALPKGDMLVLGGKAPNENAWLVTLKRTE
jgi:hypothetical protein